MTLAPLPNVLPDEELARSARPRPLAHVAADLGLGESDIDPFGRGCAKVSLDALARVSGGAKQGRLILVTAMTPTRAGEGKTVTSIGLAQGLRHIGESVVACLRQPSLGPVFGIKGCASGTGHAQLLPREEINMHLTGDFHAITSAHNLLAAVVDNSVHHANPLGIERIAWRRAVDLCDRQLREIEIGRGGKANGFIHESGFDITAASEIMAILALASDAEDLRARLARIVVGWRADGTAVLAGELRCVGSMMALLRDALRPNIVQSIDGTPTLIHCGPFANIGHGCSSVLATRLGLGACDYVVTEAGFAADLGAEKFLDLKCRTTGLAPSAAVLVASIRALRLHGSEHGAEPSAPDAAAVARGIANLRVHAENLRGFGIPVVVAANRFPGDSAEELALVESFAREIGCGFAVSEVVARGAEGGADLARAVVAAAAPGAVELRFPYALSDSAKGKVEAVATRIYRADGVDWSPAAEASLAQIERAGFGDLPICIAKTQSSISDDAKKPGAPTGWRMNAREVQVRAGAGYLVVLAGKMVLMPGLPEVGRFADIDLSADGFITGLK